MQTNLHVILIPLPLLLSGLQACTSFEQIAACKAPDAIQSTHTLIPYPPISQRLGERGTTKLEVIVGADGAPIDVAITQSSSRRLDNAAATYIKANYRWQPLAGNCKSATSSATMFVNWWLDPLADDTVLTMTQADYPSSALKRGEEGKVIVTVTVDNRALAKDAKATGSSGYPDLDARAVAIVKSSRLITPYVSVIWSLPASAIAAQRHNGVEIAEVHARVIHIEEFDIPWSAQQPSSSLRAGAP